MLIEDHIFTVKTKEPANVADVTRGGSGIVITGLNVLRDQIQVNDFVFVVFGGDKPKDWTPGLVALAHISHEPYQAAGDNGRNFRIEIDVDLFFQPSVKRSDLVSYPDTFDIIGIGPITKWEPNQALTSVKKQNAVGLLQALCDLFPIHMEKIKSILGSEFRLLQKPVRRYMVATSKLGEACGISEDHIVLNNATEFCQWFATYRGKGSGGTAKKYLGYLKTLTDAYQEPTHSYWHGLYEVMYGHKAVCEVVEIGESAEFEKHYGGILSALEKKVVSSDMDAEGCQRAIGWFWQPEVKPHTCVTSALNAYRDFLKWREDQNKGKEDVESVDDILSFAVDQFKIRRLDEDWVKQLKRDGYEGLHARYAAMNADALANMTAAEFDAWVDKELWAARVFFCGDNLKKLSETDKRAVCTFISVAKKRPQLISSYLGNGAEHINGIGPVIITEILMKFHPLDYMSYNQLMLQGLKVLGLAGSDKMPGKVTPLEYQRVVGPAGIILGKLTDAGVPRRFDEDESAAPDFVTVNEFLWWCKEHREDILKGHWEKNMKTVIKKVPQKKIDNFKDFITKLEVDVENVGLKYAPDLMKRFVCAQLAKPFVVLTGLSGSGKTKLAQAFTRWIGVKDTYKVVPVGADWTNSEKLLGYPNALDPDKYVLPDTGVLKLMIDAAQEENKDTPFFLILDEMNLSHVERYFADFLSAMESRETIKLYDGKLRTADDGTPIPQTLAIPDNLFVIGTMNVDETTYMFSPKVLDRAQVIEFRVSSEEMSDFLSEPANPKLEALNEKGAEYAEAFLGLARKRAEKKLSDDDAKRLHGVLVGVVPAGKDKPDGMFTALANLGAEFGYRSAIEIVTFVAYYLEASGYKDLTGTPRKECLNQAIDAAVLQKLLPKLHGSLNRLGPVLDALIGKVSKVKPQDNDSEAAPEIEKLYPLTYEKLLRMKDRVENNGFTSFAEA